MHFVLILILMIQSGHSLAHVSTAQLWTWEITWGQSQYKDVVLPVSGMGVGRDEKNWKYLAGGYPQEN